MIYYIVFIYRTNCITLEYFTPTHLDSLLGGRVAGAVQIGHSWAIPDDETKPADARIKSGKYIKKKSESVGQPQQQ